MNKFISVGIFFLFLSFLLAGCGTNCDPTKDIAVGQQYISIQYIRAADGVNYLDVWDPTTIKAFEDTTGGLNPTFKEITPAYKDGKFGPFYYTKNFVSPITGKPVLERMLSRTFKYHYHIKKGNGTEDVFRVEFQLSANECNTYWKLLNIYRKNLSTNKFELIDQFTGNEKADIILVE